MNNRGMGAFYNRLSLEEFAGAVLPGDTPGLMVDLGRMGELHDALAQQVADEVSRYIRNGLVPQLGANLPEEEAQSVRECVLAAIILRRQLSPGGKAASLPLGFGPFTEEKC